MSAAPRRGIVVFGATLATMVDAAEAADRAGFDAIAARVTVAERL